MTDSDRQAVLDLQNTGWTSQTSPVFNKVWTEGDLEQNLQKGMTFFVVEIDNQIAGVLDFGPYYSFPAGRHVATFGIIIAKDFRGRGFGKALLLTVLDEAKAQGYEKLAIHVMSTNNSALSLYQSLGFIEEARLTRAFDIEGQKIDALILAKDLEENNA